MTKEDSNFIRGIAVLLLLWHHLFCNWYIDTYCFFPEIVKVLAWFGRICVAMFSFLTGYGLYRKFSFLNEVNIIETVISYLKNTVVGIFRFLVGYWVALIICVTTYNFISGNCLDAKFIFGTIIGKDVKFIFSQWWYVGLYLKLLWIIPATSFVIYIIDKALIYLHIKNVYCIKFIKAFACLCVWAITYSWDGVAIEISIAMQGVLFAQTNIFEWFLQLATFEKSNRKLKKIHRMLLGLFGGILIIASAVWRISIMSSPGDSELDYIIVNGFIVGVFIVWILIKGKISKNNHVVNYINIVGKHALYLWLVHPVLLYYLVPELIQIPRWCVLEFVWLTLLSMVISLLFERIRDYLISFFGVMYKYVSFFVCRKMRGDNGF